MPFLFSRMKKPKTKQVCVDEYFSTTVAKKQQVLKNNGKMLDIPAHCVILYS